MNLYEKIHFLSDLKDVERRWWIRYYKLKTTWQTLYPEKEFKPDRFFSDIIYNTQDKTPYRKQDPWSDGFNPRLGFYVNSWYCLEYYLQDIEEELDDLGIDWVHTRLENIKFPNVINCAFHPDEGCNDCRYQSECKLRGGNI